MSAPVGVEIVAPRKAIAETVRDWECAAACFDTHNCQAALWANNDAPEQIPGTDEPFRNKCILVNGYKQQGFVVHASKWISMTPCRRYPLYGIPSPPANLYQDESQYSLWMNYRHVNYLHLNNFREESDTVRATTSHEWREWSKLCENTGQHLCPASKICKEDSGCISRDGASGLREWIPVSDGEDKWLFCGNATSDPNLSCQTRQGTPSSTSSSTVLGSFNSESANVSQHVH